jgi:hypothetical protein
VRDASERAWYRGGNQQGGTAGANNIFGTAAGFNSPIYTQTNGTQRMVIMGTNPGGSISGALGLGTIVPLSYLHVNSAGTNNSLGRLFRTDGNTADFNEWQFFTGGTEKLKLFVDNTQYTSDAGLQSTSAQMYFNTATTNPAAPNSKGLAPNSPPFKVAERLRLSYGTGGNLSGAFATPGVTKVLISHDGFGSGYLPPAVAMLNIGSSTPNPSAGNRPWMDIGTYYSMHTDNMYVGLKDEGGPNRVASVINWGDDPANTNSNNRLLYLFTGFGGQGESSTTDGLEVGRMWASANAGRMGIGGDPQINKYFGNSLDPTNTLEVNSPATFAANTTGTSGLRFTDLRATSTPQANPGTGVLSVDGNGDVILVPGGGATTTGNNGISVTAGVAQLGVPCTVGGFPNLTGIVATQLTTDRIVANRNQNFWFASLDAETGGVGVGGNPITGVPFCNTGNTFEVSANSKNTKYGSTGASGVRFTKLTSASATIPNGTNGVNSAKVLTVDGDGDVVLTNATGGAALGNSCGAATTNPLTSNWEIPLNGHNFIFSGNNLSSDRVGIGTLPSACAPQGKLHVENTTGFGGARVAGIFRNTGVDNNSVTYVGVLGISNVTGSSLLGNTGGSFNSSGAAISNVGVSASSTGGANAFGISATGTNGTTWSVAGKFDVINSNSPQNYGINSNISATNPGSTNYGALFYNSSAGSVNYGVEGIAFNGSANNFGVFGSANTGPNDWAGYFNGNVFINGGGNSPGPGLIFSDKNLKKNVATVTKPMDLILKLRPVTYNMDNSYAPQLNIDNAKTFGLIAQEVAGVIPELVKDVVVPPTYDSLGTVVTPSVAVKGLNYTGLIPIAISGIQELNNRQNIMQAQLDKAGLSDAQVKTNVNTFNALAKVTSLNPVSYNFTNANVPQLSFGSSTDYGFVAQQLETIYPELVDTVTIPASYDSLGNVVNAAKTLKTVNYKAMTALLARSIQEQQFTIDSLRTASSKQDSINNAVQQQLAALSAMINSCCSNNTRTSGNAVQNQLDVELSDKDAIVLNQNVPNPFAEQTTITYNVPSAVQKAQLIFYNSAGQIIQTVDIKTRGKGKVNVFASDLSSGLYHYTLVADGKVVDSKKMVRE